MTCSGGGQMVGPCAQCGSSGSKPCGRCNGSGNKDCGQCSNSGSTPCAQCKGSGSKDCGQCSSSGSRTCPQCKGTGSNKCDQCDGSGQMVQGDIVTRTFKPSTELTYQLSGLAENEFKNGLAAKHFASTKGDLINQQFQTPADPSTVMDRKSVHSYDVLSYRYAYKNSEFHLHQITSSRASKYVSSGLPLSWPRIGIASGIVGVATLVAASLIYFL